MRFLKEEYELSNEYDSEGNQLTRAQAEFFKNSKIRDNQDRLLVCYHGTHREFNSFDRNKIHNSLPLKGFYFIDKSRYNHVASYYSNGNKSTVKECYLNIINPLITYYPEGLEKNKAIEDGSINKYDGLIAIWKGKDRSNTYYNYFNDTLEKSTMHTGDICEIVAFEPNQIKAISNKNPTNSDNIYETL